MPHTRCCLWFDTEAEEAVTHYVSAFPNSRVTAVTRHGAGGPLPQGAVQTVDFELDGQPFVALNGGPPAGFTPALSLVIDCDSQDEVDHYWAQLSADPAAERGGWLRDRWGVSWQVVPTELREMLQHPDAARRQRVLAAVQAMGKPDISRLQEAFDIP